MTTLKPLLARNRSWALQKCQHDPDYFEKWVDGQRPHSLWIGCGHYGCGGVQAALSLPTLPLAQESSALARRIGQLRRTLHHEMAQIADGCGVEASPSAGASTGAEHSRHALDALVEANVRAQFARLLESEPVQTVLASGRPLSLHGCVYDLASGHLTTLVEHLSPQEHAP